MAQTQLATIPSARTYPSANNIYDGLDLFSFDYKCGDAVVTISASDERYNDIIRKIIRTVVRGGDFSETARKCGVSLTTAISLYRLGLSMSGRERDYLSEIALDMESKRLLDLELSIRNNSRVKIETKLERAKLYLARSLDRGGKVIQGRDADEWAIEIDSLTKLLETDGLEREDVDRLERLHVNYIKLVGLEAPKKISIEHQISMQAVNAQESLRKKLGLLDENDVYEGDVIKDVTNDSRELPSPEQIIDVAKRMEAGG